LGSCVNNLINKLRNLGKEIQMLNVFADAISTATRQKSVMTPLGDSERRRLYLEQSRRERKIAQAKIRYQR
jgi:hypothetical protein